MRCGGVGRRPWDVEGGCDRVVMEGGVGFEGGEGIGEGVRRRGGSGRKGGRSRGGKGSEE